MRRAIMPLLALSLLFVAGASQAQVKTKPGPQELSKAATEAREACVTKAMQERPTLTSDEVRSTFNPRYNIYAACVKGKGFRP